MFPEKPQEQKSDMTLTPRANIMFGGRAQISSRDAHRAPTKKDAKVLQEMHENAAVTETAITALDARNPAAYAQVLSA